MVGKLHILLPGYERPLSTTFYRCLPPCIPGKCIPGYSLYEFTPPTNTRARRLHQKRTWGRCAACRMGCCGARLNATSSLQ